MERWSGRVALVTGASGGIGLAVARLLVQHGMKVYGCARRVDRLQSVSSDMKGLKGTFHPVQCDVANESDVTSMFATIEKENGGVDVLVNNAGIGRVAPLLSGCTQDWKDMLDVNVLGLAICTREAYQSMLKRKVDDGHIINIGSIVGHQVSSSSEVHFYSCTKFAVRALTEGIRNELREQKSHIRISCISPGIVETRFSYEARGEERARAIYSSRKCLQSNDIADSVEYVLAAPPHVQVHDIIIRPQEQA